MCIKFVLNVLRIVNFIVYRVNDYGDIILSDMRGCLLFKWKFFNSFFRNCLILFIVLFYIDLMIIVMFFIVVGRFWFVIVIGWIGFILLS